MTKDILEALGPDLAAKMRASQAATAEPCGICGAGRGRWCDHRGEAVICAGCGATIVNVAVQCVTQDGHSRHWFCVTTAGIG